MPLPDRLLALRRIVAWQVDERGDLVGFQVLNGKRNEELTKLSLARRRVAKPARGSRSLRLRLAAARVPEPCARQNATSRAWRALSLFRFEPCPISSRPCAGAHQVREEARHVWTEGVGDRRVRCARGDSYPWWLRERHRVVPFRPSRELRHRIGWEVPSKLQRGERLPGWPGLYVPHLHDRILRRTELSPPTS